MRNSEVPHNLVALMTNGIREGERVVSMQCRDAHTAHPLSEAKTRVLFLGLLDPHLPIVLLPDFLTKQLNPSPLPMVPGYPYSGPLLSLHKVNDQMNWLRFCPLRGCPFTTIFQGHSWVGDAVLKSLFSTCNHIPRQSIHKSTLNFLPPTAGNGEPVPRGWRIAINVTVAASMGCWAICACRLLVLSGPICAWTSIYHFRLTTDCCQPYLMLRPDGSDSR